MSISDGIKDSMQLLENGSPPIKEQLIYAQGDQYVGIKTLSLTI